MPKRQINKLTKPPAADYLIAFTNREGTNYATGERCGCKSTRTSRPSGCWVVAHDGDHYTFSPSTQLQKDIWIDSAAQQLSGKDAAIKMLRWFCFVCCTVQLP